MTRVSHNIFPASDCRRSHAEVGGDPIQSHPWEHLLPGHAAAGSSARSFVELLNQPWLPMPDLFTMRQTAQGYPSMFYAQSWIVMHYLLSQNKLSDAGTYFGMVEIQKASVEQAIQQAFGVSAAQFEQNVKDSFAPRRGRKRQRLQSQQVRQTAPARFINSLPSWKPHRLEAVS